jgi:FkbM family methyltransferase
MSINSTFSIGIESVSPFQYSAVCGDAIGSALFWSYGKDFEPETVKVFVKVVKTCRRFFDVGANTGIFSLLACAANSKISVVALEPVPRICQRLTENIRINGWTDRCATVNQAVSNEVEEVVFHVPNSALPTSSSLNVNGFRGTYGDLFAVKATTIDAIVSEFGMPDLLKVDVEGYEDKVFEGMTGILETAPPVMVVECLPDGPHNKYESILGAYGYRYFQIVEEGLRCMRKIEPDRSEVYRNFMFVPPSRLSWVEQHLHCAAA